MFTPSTKRRLREFHVVHVQWRQRNVQKRCAERAKLFFADYTYCCYFYVLLAVAEIFAKAPHCACVKGLETLPYSPVKQFDDVIISLKSF